VETKGPNNHGLTRCNYRIVIIKVTGEVSGEGACSLLRNFLIKNTVDMLF